MTAQYPQTSGTIVVDTHERTASDGSVWQMAAYDPYAVSYFDDASQALDETNYDALRDAIGRDDIGAAYSRYDYSRDAGYAVWVDVLETADGTPCDLADLDAVVHGSYRYHSDFAEWELRSLWVRVDSDAWTVWRECATAVSDYPLLDESAYSEREYDEWISWCGNGLDFDTARQLREWGVDDETANVLSDADVLRSESTWLDYSDGFTGEHSPDMALVVLASAVDNLASLWFPPRGQTWERRADHHPHRASYI